MIIQLTIKKLANGFNNFFINIGSNLADKKPKVNGSIYEYMTRNPNSIFTNK
jgi:hypothetical protein